jgi:hypothetical protein
MFLLDEERAHEYAVQEGSLIMWTDGQFLRVQEPPVEGVYRQSIYRIYPYVQRAPELDVFLEKTGRYFGKSTDGHLIYAPPAPGQENTFRRWRDGGLPGYVLFETLAPQLTHADYLEYFRLTAPPSLEAVDTAVIAYATCPRRPYIRIPPGSKERIYILGFSAILRVSEHMNICRIYGRECPGGWIQTVDLRVNFHTVTHVSVVSDPGGSQRRWILIMGLDAVNHEQPRYNIYTTTDIRDILKDRPAHPPRLLSSAHVR